MKTRGGGVTFCGMSQIRRNLSPLATTAAGIACGIIAATVVTVGLGARVGARRTAAGSMQEWPVYAADQAATHFSPLTDIDRNNVAKLAVAWEWKTGDGDVQAPAGVRPGVFENTPLMIDDVLYVRSEERRVGKEC